MNDSAGDPRLPPADPRIAAGREMREVEAFTAAFRRHAAGVAIITAVLPDGRPTGFTATSLASLSARPPLATFNMAQVSTSWPAMALGNQVVIHTLGSNARHQAERMSADSTARFVGEHWHYGVNGLPIIDDATSWMVGTIIDIHRVQKSATIFVQIVDGGLGEEDQALLYYQRNYFTPGRIPDAN